MVNTIEPAIGASQRRMVYVIDGLLVGNQSAPCETTGDADFNVTVFSIRDLTLGNHEFTITTLNSGSPTAFWLDYFLIYSDPPLAEDTSCSTAIAPTRTTDPDPLPTEEPTPSRSTALLPLTTSAQSMTHRTFSSVSPSVYELPHTMDPIFSLVSVEPYFNAPPPSISGMDTATAPLIPVAHFGHSSVAGNSDNSASSATAGPPSIAHGNVAPIVGGVLGGAVLFLLILVIVFVVRRRRKNASTGMSIVSPFR